ncbi:hypothetical protein AKJ53_01510 [candidate division MSBL1 archaeon SCGC-AAA382F02]|uniref:Uncharacterized protein n=1 Tax=candidate division MSBL1 archaeon SCGC-AAA382F02 TaxID=1698282 RepID=A0A133VHX2_9EURY|nr:hypothetical protein AKJ53_01510 [candidate division MSBL1 archaeon SCGC-AAA382F02]
MGRTIKQKIKNLLFKEGPLIEKRITEEIYGPRYTQGERQNIYHRVQILKHEGKVQQAEIEEGPTAWKLTPTYYRYRKEKSMENVMGTIADAVRGTKK